MFSTMKLQSRQCGRTERKAMYVRKTVDAWVLEGNYGCGWEYLLTEYTKKEGMERLREYRENQPQYPVRLIKKRERKAAAV